MPKESIYDEYFRYTELHKKTYGENTFVLIQIGKFYEVYAYKLPDGEFGGANLKEYSKICELHMACKTNTFYKGFLKSFSQSLKITKKVSVSKN